MNAFTPVDRNTLSHLDWRVVEMAREDGPRTLNPDGFLASLARFFGMSVPNGLANERLEALRRFSVRAWHWDLIRDKDVRAFLEAGHTRSQMLEILSRVSLVRGFMPTIDEDSHGRLSPTRSSGCRCG